MVRRTKKTTKNDAETYRWLMATTRIGRRIEKLSWKKLAEIYIAAKPGSPYGSLRDKIRKAINAEARRCGYTPRTILALNAE